MAQRLSDLMSGVGPGKMVAGRIYTSIGSRGEYINDFYYVETDLDAPVPAAVLIDNWMDANRYGGPGWGERFLLNSIGSFAWLNTYTARFHVLEARNREARWFVTPRKVTHGSLHDSFSMTKLGPEPGLTGLHTTEIQLEDELIGEATPREVRQGKRTAGEKFIFATAEDMHPYLREYTLEVNRARRYYLLAAYCLLGKSQLFTHRGIAVNNLVASILIDDSGKVLSWGVNTGSYRHAEVNTLLNYFKETGKKRLPARSTLFSTLKPCAMCSAYIKNSLPDTDQTRVWYGQFDPGPSGSTPLLGDLAKSFHGTVSNKPVMVANPRGGGKIGISEGLEASFARVANQAAAAWTRTSREAKDLFALAAQGLEHKLAKARQDGPKEKVLRHLQPWIEGGFT